MAKNRRPSDSSPKSKISTMCGEPSRLAARASSRNTWTMLRLLAQIEAEDLEGDRRSMSTCSASYTTPMPPSPSQRTIR